MSSPLVINAWKLLVPGMVEAPSYRCYSVFLVDSGSCFSTKKKINGIENLQCSNACFAVIIGFSVVGQKLSIASILFEVPQDYHKEICRDFWQRSFNLHLLPSGNKSNVKIVVTS